MMTDPIADMLTRTRNALVAQHKQVAMPSSKMKVGIARILKEEGFIKAYKVLKDRRHGILRIILKYTDNESVISGLKRISKPGRRVYVGRKEIPRVIGGLGIAILTTSKGEKCLANISETNIFRDQNKN